VSRMTEQPGPLQKLVASPWWWVFMGVLFAALTFDSSLPLWLRVIEGICAGMFLGIAVRRFNARRTR
jgi:hypothetical protein